MKEQMFTRRIMLATLLTLFACLQSFASNTTYYAKLSVAASPTGAGKVYVGSEENSIGSDPVTSRNTTATGRADVSFYVSAEANVGYEFMGWETDPDATTYATYYSKVWVHPGEGGRVAINKTGNEPGAYSILKYQAEQNSKAAQAATHTYYIFAQAKEGYEFIGWSKEEGGDIVSTDARYEVKVSAESNKQGAPTEHHFYANFNINKTEDTYLTIKSQMPTEGMTIKYTAASQNYEPDASKGEFEKSNITAAIEFNEVVYNIDQSKAPDITLTNITEGVNYRYTNLTLPAQLVDGRTAIAYPELVNGEYTMTIPEGLFVGEDDKVNKAITISFSVTGFNSVQLKPYEMSTDVITPNPNDMAQTIEELEKIEISYKGEFGVAEAIVGDASDIKIQRYTEEIDGSTDGGSSKRTYYPAYTTPYVEVVDGKMVVIFFPAIEATGMYEVQIPAGMAANMKPGEMSMVEKVNAGYAETPAYSNLSFNVKAPVRELEVTMVVSAAKYGTFIAPFDVEIPEGVTASSVRKTDNTTLILNPLTTSTIPAETPVILQSEEPVEKTFKGEVSRYFDPEVRYIDGYLVGVFQKTKAPVNSYVLQMQNNKVAFYVVKEEVGQPDILPYRCYISEAAGYAPAFYFVEDDATAINGINPEFINAEAIYNVNGVRISTLQKGLNIIKTANGTKKVVIK